MSHDLGSLPGNSALKSTPNKTNAVRQILRSVAIKNQREQPRVFYSLREVGQRYKLPVSTVARIYRDLEQEGLLSRMRSSKTILNGLRHNRRLSVRAFIGLPALLQNFIAIQDYRTFFNCMRRELWMRGFAGTMVFFKPHQLIDGTLSDQLKSYDFDTVIWFHPGRTATETFMRLSDMGIRVIVVSGIGTPTLSSRYYVWNNRAIEAVLRDWRHRHSVRKVIVVDSKDYRSLVTEELVRLILPTLQIEFVHRTFEGEDTASFLTELGRTKTDGIIFPSSGLASMFTFRSPQQVADLLKARRVAFVDGPIDLPFTKVPDVPVDLVVVNWPNVVESIVSDLTTREAYDRNRNTTFEAEARLRVPLSSFCEEIRPLRSIAAPE
jgi:DNA-binding transcriptional regulator YhcF (GntR family)